MKILIKRFNCFVDTIWDTFKRFLKTGEAIPVMGHVYSNHEVIRNCILVISTCKDCGRQTFAWHKEGSINDEELIELYGKYNQLS